jgi:hypothetical protein
MEENKKLQLINTLTESRLFRNKNIASEVNVDDAAELAFVYLMTLNMWNKDYDFAPLAKEYAARTAAFGNFNTFRTSGTDLYIALNRLLGTDQSYDNDKDKVAIDRIKVSQQELKKYLQHIATNSVDPAFEQRMLLRFQKGLNIQDAMLKSIRRLVGDWDNLNQHQRALVVTRLTQYTRSKAMRSEMMQPLLKFQKRGNYIVDDSADTKKSLWDKPIVKAAAAAGAIYGAGKLGKQLAKSTYKTQRTGLAHRFGATDKSNKPK